MVFRRRATHVRTDVASLYVHLRELGFVENMRHEELGDWESFLREDMVKQWHAPKIS